MRKTKRIIATTKVAILFALMLNQGCGGDYEEYEEHEPGERLAQWNSSYGNGALTKKMAKIALWAYDDKPSARIYLGGESHAYYSFCSIGRFRVYGRVDTSSRKASYILSIRGTDKNSREDILDDIKGMTATVTAKNPWSGEENGRLEMGKGFHDKVKAYLESEQGQKFKSYLSAKMAGSNPWKKLVIHITGHSLGGIRSQIAAYYIGSWIMFNFKADQRKNARVLNFAFNSPLGTDGAQMPKRFKTLIDDNLLRVFNWTVKNDKYSKNWVGWDGPVNAGNDVKMIWELDWTTSVDYCPDNALADDDRPHSMSRMIERLNFIKFRNCYLDGLPADFRL